MTRREYQKRIDVLKSTLQKYGKKCSVFYRIRLYKNKRTEQFAGRNDDWHKVRYKDNVRYTRQHGQIQVIMPKQESVEALTERYNYQTLDGIHRKDIAEIMELSIKY